MVRLTLWKKSTGFMVVLLELSKKKINFKSKKHPTNNFFLQNALHFVWFASHVKKKMISTDSKETAYHHFKLKTLFREREGQGTT